MTSYIERYRRGEREAVWSELSDLGARVFEDPILGDALEVARETMRRARQNIEMLIERLDERGYRFADPASSALSGLDTISTLSAQLGSLASGNAGNANVHVQALLGRFSAVQSKLMPILNDIRSQASTASQEKPKAPLQNPNIYIAPSAATPELIDRLQMEIGGPLPLSLRAWYEEVGAVSLLGSDPVLNPMRDSDLSTRDSVDRLSKAISMPRARSPGESLQDWYARMRSGYQSTSRPPAVEPQILADPLVIFPIEELLDQLSDRERDSAGEAVELVIAPDDLHKADISGDATYLTLPQAQADFQFDDWRRTGFVDYLRAVFRWGGFPGWERSANPPNDVIAELTEGLLPI